MYKLPFLLFIILLNYSTSLIPSEHIDFYTSMAKASLPRVSSWWENKIYIKDIEWLHAKKLYDTWYNTSFNTKKNLKIPKILHHIWVGPRPFSDRSKQLRKTWFDYHSNWKFVFWTDNPNNFPKNHVIVTSFTELKQVLDQQDIQFITVDVRYLSFSHKQLFASIKNYGGKSDVLRYEILYEIGGLYVDTDFECIKPFDSIHTMCHFYIGAGHGFYTNRKMGTGFEVYNGLMGSSVQNPLIKKILENLPQNIKNNKSETILVSTGPHYITKILSQEIQKINPHNKIIIFPLSFFYPWPSFDRYQKNEHIIKNWIQSESYAIHHWHTSWGEIPRVL